MCTRALLLEASPENINRIVATMSDLTAKSPSGKCRLGSICSGSGAGEIGMKTLFTVLQQMVPTVTDDTTGGTQAVPLHDQLECVFCCEYDERKVGWLSQNIVPPCIFDNAGNMGFRTAFDRVSNTVKDS